MVRPPLRAPVAAEPVLSTPGTAHPTLPLARFLVAMLFLGVVTGMVSWWIHSRIEVSTDNAYVVGNITPISAEVSGPVVALYVDDNMMVQPGDPIAQIDPVPFQAQVDQALADSRQAQFDAQAAAVNVGFYRQDRRSLRDGAVARQAEAEEGIRAAEIVLGTRAQLLAKDRELLASLLAQKPGLEAIMANAREYYNRFNRLSGTGDVPVQDRDNREATYREAVAKLKSLEITSRPPSAGSRQRPANPRGGDPARAKSQGPGQCPGHGRPGRRGPDRASGRGIHGERPPEQGSTSRGETHAGTVELEQHARSGADRRDHQSPHHPARSDGGSAPPLSEHRTARPRRCLGRGRPPRGGNDASPGS